MSIVRWNPWDDASSMQDRINRLFDDSFPIPRGAADRYPDPEWDPVVDVFDTEEAIVIHAELPGLTKEDLSIEAKGNTLSLKGEKCECTTIDEDACRQRERCFGVFHKTFTLPAAVEFEKIRATFANGVLELTIPKPRAETPTRITI